MFTAQPADETTLNPKRSKSTVPLQCNVSVAVARQLRHWAAHMDGRTGLVISRLVEQELARQEEKARIRRAIDGGP